MNSIQKKIIYINIMMLIMLLAGIGFGIVGFAVYTSVAHTIILESIAVPLVLAASSMLGMELKHYLKIRHTQEKGN